MAKRKWKTHEDKTTWLEIDKGFCVQAGARDGEHSARVVVLQPELDIEHVSRDVPGNPTLKELRPLALKAGREFFQRLADACKEDG